MTICMPVLCCSRKRSSICRVPMSPTSSTTTTLLRSGIYRPISTRLRKAATEARSAMPADLQIGGLAPGQGDAEHLAPVGFPGVHQRRQGGALAGAGDADRDTQPAAGWRAWSSSPAGPAIALRPDRSPDCAPGRPRPRGRSALPAKRPTNRARRSWPAGSARVPGRYAAPSSHSSAPCRAAEAPLPHSSATCWPSCTTPRSRKLLITASMSSPGRSPIPATINARAAISRNSWPSNTARRPSSPSSNGRAAR